MVRNAGRRSAAWASLRLLLRFVTRTRDPDYLLVAVRCVPLKA